jgi:hypothetical protein
VGGVVVDAEGAAGHDDAQRPAVGPEAAKRAPRTALGAVRALGRQLPLGIVGELSIWGARRAPFINLESWQLGAAAFRPTT